MNHVLLFFLQTEKPFPPLRGGIWGGGREVWCIAHTVALYQRPFVFITLRVSSWEPPHDAAFINGGNHIPHRMLVLPSAPLLFSRTR